MDIEITNSKSGESSMFLVMENFILILVVNSIQINDLLKVSFN